MRTLINLPLLSLIFVLWGIMGFVVPSISDRLTTVERTVEACCGTEHGLWPEEEAAFAAHVALKKRVQELERELEELKAVMGLRK